MKRIKVLYICNESVLGGAAQSLVDMLKEICKYVNPVVIIPNNGDIEGQLNKMEIKYYIVPFMRALGKIGKYSHNDENKCLMDNYEAAMKIAFIADNENVDLIHTNSSAGNVGAIAALMMKLPHIWHIREFLQEDYGCEFLNKELKIELLQQADFVITISNYMKQNFYNKYKIESVFIYDGLDIKKYKNDIDIFQKAGANFLLAGGINQGKGQLEAVKAIEILKNWGNNDVKLTIVGSGTNKYFWVIKKYIKKNGLQDNIVILSFSNDLSEIRRNTTFSLTCSRLEALGRVTIEAMLAGNIVIGADTGGTLELIGEDQERGYLYRQGNCLELAKVMKKAMEVSYNEQTVYRKKAQEFALSQFDTVNYVKKIYDIYNIVIQKANLKEKLSERQEILNKLEKQYEKIKSSSFLYLKEDKKDDKFRRLFFYEEQWLHIRQSNHSLIEYFSKNKINTIAIYGMGYLGCNLYDELEDSEIAVLYVIDQNPENLSEIVPVVSFESDWDKVDVVVITVIDEEEDLKSYIKNKHHIRTIGLKEILDDFGIL